MDKKQETISSFMFLFLLTLLLLLPIPESSYAETFPSSTSQQMLQSGHKIQVTNDDMTSTLAIMGESKRLFERKIDAGYIEKITQIPNDLLLVEYRLYGTGAFLRFEVIQVKDSQVVSVFQSADYIKGSIRVTDEILDLTYPKYSSYDSLAEPSHEMTERFAITQNGIKSMETIEKKLKSTVKIQSVIEDVNPSYSEINRFLTEEALKQDVPPEIVKAIAMQESWWRQFTSVNGEKQPLIGFDGRGIGIMQVTPPLANKDTWFAKYNTSEEFLKNDIRENIRVGVKILAEKWQLTNDGTKYQLPKINDGSRNVIDHWYFAIMAYNGRSKVNDPIAADNTYKPYQDFVYEHLDRYGLVSMTPFPKQDLVIEYEGDIMLFGKKLQYSIPGPYNYTRHSYKQYELTQVKANVSLRPLPNTSNEPIRTIQKDELLRVTGPILYENNRSNQFVWYPVQDLKGNKGYVASSYMNPIDPKYNQLTFEDYFYPQRGYFEVASLTQKHIISGFPDNTFRPATPLTRTQAAILIVNAKGLDTTNVINPGFKDVSPDYQFYKYIAAAQNAGIFLGSEDGHFNGNQKMKRGEMAAVLVRAYGLNYPGNKVSSFKDTKYSRLEKDIETIYYNKITEGIRKDYFGINDPITRLDFSIFLYRTIDVTSNK